MSSKGICCKVNISRILKSYSIKIIKVKKYFICRVASLVKFYIFSGVTSYPIYLSLVKVAKDVILNYVNTVYLILTFKIANISIIYKK